MRKVKYKLFVDYDKEEKWVNEMSKKGWHLEKFAFFRFVFQKGEPGKYIYRNEFLGGLSKKEKEEYFEIIRDSGATIINENFSWVYMRKPVAEGAFELYTDNDSKISYYNRILSFFYLLFLINICFAISNISSSIQTNLGIFNLSLGIFNVLVAVIIAVLMLKITKHKKKLQLNKKFFE